MTTDGDIHRLLPLEERFSVPPAGLRVLIGLLFVLGVLSVAARVPYIQGPRGTGADFSQDYVSARAWKEGLNPYQPLGPLVSRYLGPRTPYFDLVPGGARTTHPPIFIVLVSLLAELGYKNARIVWLFFSAISAATAVGLLLRRLGLRPIRTWALAVASLALPVVQTDLVYGQSNGILLLFLMLGWVWLEEDKDWLAGASLGMAAALKIFPILLIIPLMRLRRFRAIRAQLLVAACMSLIGVAFIGLSNSLTFVRSGSSSDLRFWRSAPMNLSLVAVPYRWLTRSIWRLHGVNVSLLASALAVLLTALCIIGLLRTSGSCSGSLFWDSTFWILLVTPLVWESYLVLLIPGVLLFLRRLWKGQNRTPVLLAGPAAAFLMIGLIPGLPPPAHTPALAQLFGYSLPLYGLLVLAILSLGRPGSIPLRLA